MNFQKTFLNLGSIIGGLFLGWLAFDACLQYKVVPITFVYGLIAAGLILFASFWGKLKWREFKWAVLIAVIFYFYRLAVQNYWLPKTFEFLDAPVIVIAIAWSLRRSIVRIWNSLRKRGRFNFAFSRKGLYLALGISFGLSAFYVVLMLLRHWSFETHAYDFGIFDQALFMISRTGIPESTVRQFTNLFFDHQHFSLYLLAPLYWIGKGFSGTTLIILTPFLLITFPALILYRSAIALGRAFKLEAFEKPYWVIGLASFLLWLHPFTQSSAAFFFHEKYLIPIFFGLTLLFVLLGFEKKKNAFFWLALLPSIAWTMTKEDQWIFVLVFWVQILFWGWLLWKPKAKNLKPKTSFCLQTINYKLLVIITLTGIVISLAYGLWFLDYFKSHGPSNIQYSEEYNHLIEPLKSGNASQVLEELQWNEHVKLYAYQNFLLFDLPGIAPFPLNILGNYAERLLAKTQAYRNPIFHHGAEVPVYAVTGIFLTYLWFRRKDSNKANRFLALVIVSFTLGFGSVLGWNDFYYITFESGKTIRALNQTSEERKAFSEIRKCIPDDASLVTSAEYVPHLSAREKVVAWPNLLKLKKGTPGRTDYSNFDYWLLPKIGKFNRRIGALRGFGETVCENEHQILIKN